MLGSTQAQATAMTADKPTEKILSDAESAVLQFAFRGYVAIVFPVGPENGCTVEPKDVTRRFRDNDRSWFEVTVSAKCQKFLIEPYNIWFLCSKGNQHSCLLIPAPNLSEMTK